MLIKIELRTLTTKGISFEKFIHLQLAEAFCKGIGYGQQGFNIMEIVDVDSDKRYQFTGPNSDILIEKK